MGRPVFDDLGMIDRGLLPEQRLEAVGGGIEIPLLELLEGSPELLRPSLGVGSLRAAMGGAQIGTSMVSRTWRRAASSSWRLISVVSKVLATWMRWARTGSAMILMSSGVQWSRPSRNARA